MTSSTRPESPHRRGPHREPGLNVEVGDVAHSPGAVRRVERSVVLDVVGAGAARMGADSPVDLRLRLDGVAHGVVVSGDVSGVWSSECSRCLEPVAEPFVLSVRELFEADPVESETYELSDDAIDLEPMLVDTIALHLPLAPLCSDECLGLCPACGSDRNTVACGCDEDVRDERWQVLGDLDFDGS